jgi:hypothetical protein
MLHRGLAVFLGLHGFAHLVGFLGSWKLGDFADAPYTTLIVNGAFDVGDAGIRVVGVLWLVATAAFVVAAVALWQERPTAVRIVLAATAFSLAICIIGLPAGIIGVGIDMAILLALATLAVARPAVLRTAIR